MTLATAIDWTNVLVALIAGVPSTIAAVGVLFVQWQIRTPSGMPLGRQLEAAHHTAIANNQRLVSINDKLHAQPSALAAEEEAQVPKLNGESGETH